MKILKHIWRVLSTHSGPYQGLNMITTDCQNCLNNFHFLNTIFTFSRQLFAKKDYKSMAASLSLVTLVSPCQWMAATASILAKISSVWRKKEKKDYLIWMLIAFYVTLAFTSIPDGTSFNFSHWCRIRQFIQWMDVGKAAIFPFLWELEWPSSEVWL